jgi:hypothetical protein
MIRRALVLAAGLVVMALLGAAPAWAHGGPIAIAVHGDGGQGITATVIYARDGHAVTEQVDMTYTAVSAGGKTIGPFSLTASAEGQSFYVSKNPLPVGDWTVTVTATHPSPATQTVSVTSAELPPAGAAPAPAASGLPATALVAIPVAVAVAALAVALVLRRRRLSMS